MAQSVRFKSVYLLIVLIPIVLWISASCSTSPKQIELTDETVAQWDATVEKTITEPQRAARLKELGKQLIDISESFQQDVELYNQKAMGLNENYYATTAEFHQLLNEYMAKRDTKFTKYREIIFAMRSEVSAKEWKALMK